MKYKHDAASALDQFSKAIELAADRLTPADGEWAYAYWHRATAERQLGNSTAADKDFAVAENSLRDAEKSIGNDTIAAYYHELVNRIVEQRGTH